MSCDECIASSFRSKLSQVVCPHVSKLSFFKNVTKKYNLSFKRSDSDQCEECNKLHPKIILLRTMGRHDEANSI